MSRLGRGLKGVAAGAVLMLAGAEAPALAADFEVAPMVGVRTGGELSDKNSGERYEFGDDSSIGLSLAWDLDGQSFIEVSVMTTATSLSPISGSTAVISYEMDVTDIQVGGHYAWNTGPVRPYILGSLGVTLWDPTDPAADGEANFSFAVGGGVKGYFGKHFGLRGDVRMLGTATGGTSEIFCVGDECLKPSGTVVFQFEARAGVIVRF